MILPSQQIAALIDAGYIRLGDDDGGAAPHALPPTLQPASLDLDSGSSGLPDASVVSARNADARGRWNQGFVPA